MPFTHAELILIGLIVVCIISVAMARAAVRRVESRTAGLGRVEAKLDLLLKQANIRFDPFAGVQADIAQALRDGRKIEAIKLYREATGVGLKEAKDYVDTIERRGG